MFSTTSEKFMVGLIDFPVERQLGTSTSAKNRQQWNTIPKEQKDLVLRVALVHQALSPSKGLFIRPVHILLSASREFKDKPCFAHQL